MIPLVTYLWGVLSALGKWSGGKFRGKGDKRLVRIYELVFIVNPEVEGEELDGVIANVTRLIEREGGSVLQLDPWGLRRLAYPIQDYREGTYFFMYAELEPLAVREFESSISLLESIMRHLIVRAQGEVKITPPAPEVAIEPVVVSEAAEKPEEGETAESPISAETQVEEAAAVEAESAAEPAEEIAAVEAESAAEPVEEVAAVEAETAEGESVVASVEETEA